LGSGNGGSNSLKEYFGTHRSPHPEWFPTPPVRRRLRRTLEENSSGSKKRIPFGMETNLLGYHVIIISLTGYMLIFLVIFASYFGEGQSKVESVF